MDLKTTLKNEYLYTPVRGTLSVVGECDGAFWNAKWHGASSWCPGSVGEEIFAGWPLKGGHKDVPAEGQP